jgi:methanogenic corrinoid protein MtbC1
MYPIRTVSKLTGLSLDTLRAWERRYGAVRPSRGERGRVYDEAAVRRLTLLRDAVARGYAIGQVAAMGDEELDRLLASGPFAARAAAPLETPGGAVDLRAVVEAVAAFDAVSADRELGRLAALLPPRDLVHRVVVPLMRHVGEAWERGEMSIAEEHMTSGVLRNLLGTLVRMQAGARPAARLVFATPTGEQHEFGILCAAMLAAGGGLGVVYLGTDLPAAEIAAAADRSGASAVVLGVTGAAGLAGPLEAIERVRAALPARAEVWVGGGETVEVEREVRRLAVRYFEDLGVYERALAGLGAAL